GPGPDRTVDADFRRGSGGGMVPRSDRRSVARWNSASGRQCLVWLGHRQIPRKRNWAGAHGNSVVGRAFGRRDFSGGDGRERGRTFGCFVRLALRLVWFSSYPSISRFAADWPKI